MAYQILDKDQNVLETVEDIDAWISSQGEGQIYAYDDGIFDAEYISGNSEAKVFKLVE
tara:strand:+ start:632 stop:805 length:174 start_codon:yes stop_codon:yes gene_type:complete